MTPHEWLEEPEFSVVGDELTKDDVGIIRPGFVDDSVRMLEDQEFVKISNERAEEISQNRLKIPESKSAYIVRGVSWTRRPLCYKIRNDRNTGNIFVQQYTYTGPIYVPSLNALPSPVVVILEQAPKNVIPMSYMGDEDVRTVCLANDAIRG